MDLEDFGEIEAMKDVTERQHRLECLKVARDLCVGSRSAEEVIQDAKALYAFVSGDGK